MTEQPGLLARIGRWFGWGRDAEDYGQGAELIERYAETRALAAPETVASSEERPDAREYRELPALRGTVWDRKRQLDQIIYALEDGQFGDAARLADQMRRDDRIRACEMTRTKALVSVPVEWEAAQIRGRETSKTRAVRDAAKLDWPKMVSPSAIAKLAYWGRRCGIGIGEWVWDTSGERWVPRLKVWHPQWLDWDWTRRCYRLQVQGIEKPDGTYEGGGWVYLPRTDREVWSDGHWVIYTPDGYEYAWMEGNVRALADLYLYRRWDWRDWARRNEVHGLPIRKAVVPSGGDVKDKDRFVRSLSRLGNETTLECPDGGPGKKYDLELVESTVRGAETFGEMMDRLDASIGAVELGQNASGPKVATLSEDGRAGQDEAVRSDLVRADCRIYETLTEQGLTWWTLYNYGDRALTPKPVPQLEPKVDQAKKAGALQGLAGALLAFADAGAPIDQRAILEDEGLPLLDAPEEDEDAEVVAGAPAGDAPKLELTPTAIGAITKVNEARKSQGMGPLTRTDGTPDPDGELSIAEYLAKKAAVVAKGEAAQQGDAGAAEQASTQETLSALIAGRFVEVTWRYEPEQITTLAAGAARRALLAARPARLASGRYAERLAARARARAVAALGPDLKAIMVAVQSATSFDDLRDRLVEQYRSMSPERLARLVEKARIMAELSGRYEVLESL